MEKHENQQRSRINKAFKKIPRFDGTNPSYCFDWLEQTEALVNERHGRIYREELLLNCGTSVSKTIHTLPQGAANQRIKDAVLRNHSNLSANYCKPVSSSSYAGCFLPCLLVLLFLRVGSLRLFWGMVMRGCARRDLC